MSEWKECNPSTWLRVKLGEVGKVLTGKTPSKDNPEDWGSEVLFITPSDYRNYGKKASTSLRMLSSIGVKRQNGKLLPPNSVLVTCIGSDMGKSVLNAKACVTNQQINAIIPDNSKVNNDYLYYVTIELYETLRSLGGDGTAVPILNKSDFENIPILLPPLPEQRAIAGVLSSLDDKIDLLHRQNKTLEAMAETLFRQWFVEPFDSAQGREVAEVKVAQISDLIDFNPQRSLVKGTIAPYLEMANVNTSVFHPDNWYEREYSSGMRFINGDTLLARITPCLENGKSAFVTFLEDDQVGWGSTEFIVIRSKGALHPLFTYCLAKNRDFRDYAEGCLEGSSGRQRVDVGHLSKYEIVYPKDSIIHEFNKVMESIEPKLHRNFIQIRTLEKLRDTLLPKLMSGEVRCAERCPELVEGPVETRVKV